MLNSFYDKFIFTNNIKFKENNFFISQLPFVIMPANILALHSNENTQENKAIYYLFKESSKNFFDAFKQVFSISNEKIIDFTLLYFSASGLGKFTLIDLNEKNKKAIISVQSNPFAKSIQFKAKSNADHMLRGMLAGIFSKAFNAEIDCIETKCSAVNSNECIFVLQEKNSFDFTEQIVREQLKL